MSNSFGRIFRLTTFGESHGEVMGGVLDGCPSEIVLDVDFIRDELSRRQPKADCGGTTRKETDEVRFLSGVFEGKTTGAPIAFVIENKEVRSEDYAQMTNTYRPGHADFTYHQKYGHYDYRGGGRASARETVVRVVAGAIAKQVLLRYGIRFASYLSQVGTVVSPKQEYTFEEVAQCTNYPVHPSLEISALMAIEVEKAKRAGDSVGGVVTCMIDGLPVGLGEPLYDKLQARLAYAMMSIPAAKGFEYGCGFEAAAMRGTLHNDSFVCEGGRIKTARNLSGGILGGISTGETVLFRTAFKPTPTISVPQQTVTHSKETVEVAYKGRHDTCLALRAGVVVEAMAAMVVLDCVMLQQTEMHHE